MKKRETAILGCHCTATKGTARLNLLSVALCALLAAGCSSTPAPSDRDSESAGQPAPTTAERAAARRSNAPGSPTPVQPEPGPGRTSNVEALRLQLIAMAGNDQEIRGQIFSKPVAQITRQERDQLEALDKANSARLREIIDTHGWPGKSLVGREAADAAFLILQHANLELQKKALPLVEQAYRSGEAQGQDLALLTDRVRVGQGKPQLYGTQVLISSDGQLTIEPIEDEPRLNERRAQLGLPSHEEYLSTLKQAYKTRN